MQMYWWQSDRTEPYTIMNGYTDFRFKISPSAFEAVPVWGEITLNQMDSVRSLDEYCAKLAQ